VYYFSKILEIPYEKAIEKTIEELKKEGFGVLTEIDVKKTLKNKLDVDFRRYMILGACNPPFAYKALTTDDKIGLLLPCNVVIQEKENFKVEVSAIDPIAMLSIIENPSLKEIALKIKEKLAKVIYNL
jgi:uncharacterized protein (DUF302 family)